MLIIRHLSGPNAGTSDRIDSKVNRVIFGRGRDCQIGYPPEETIISRQHFALVRKPPGPTGHWTVELFGDPFVAMNGVAADPGQKATNGAIFELGKRGGPSFKLLIEPDQAADNLPVTDKQEQDKGPRALAVRARRLALAGLALAIAVALAGSYYYFSIQGLMIDGAARDQLVRSAFLVETPGGTATAWPVAARLLATNAHVAKHFEELHPGNEMLVRAPARTAKCTRSSATKSSSGASIR